MNAKYIVLLITNIFALFGTLVQGATDLNFAYGHAPRSCISTPASSIKRVSLTKYIADNFDASATVPFQITCQYSVFVDSSVTVRFPHGLIILGTLEFPELRNRIKTFISTPFVLVRGRLLIGKQSAQYTSQVEFRLTNSTKDIELKNESENGLFDNLMNFGKKAFVVYGGQVLMYGQYAGPTYVTLGETASVNTKQITVTTKNSGGMSRKLHQQWKVGDRIAISPTVMDSQTRYSSLATIAAITQSPTDPLSYTIKLRNALDNVHTVRRVQLTDGSGKTALLAAVITKLDRNIKISGLPDKYTQETIEDWWRDEGADDGGHFTIANTAESIVVQGVESSAMGQPGMIGRYPIHTHFLGNVKPNKSVIRKNSVHHSKQRCYVIHATDGMEVRSNVAFRALGHCFLTEDGIEQNNAFIGNVVVGLQRARRIIALTPSQPQSDGQPSGFWMASPKNRIIRNVVGGADMAFWFQARHLLLGQSRDVQLPGWKDLYPARLPMQKFKKNSAHSSNVGLATYPQGLAPEGPTAIMEDFYAFSVGIGWRVNIGRNQHLRNSVFVDVRDAGVGSQFYHGLTISNTVFSGAISGSNNCAGVSSAIELDALGSIVDWTRGLGGFVFKNVHLQNWEQESNCRRSFGVQIQFKTNDRYLPAATKLSGISFSKVDKELYFDYSRVEGYGKTAGLFVENSGGVTGKAFVVNSDFSSEAVLTRGCVRNSRQLSMWEIDGQRDMYLCPNACWRQAHIAFQEADFEARLKPIKVRFTSQNDQTLTFDENPQKGAWFTGGRKDSAVNVVMPAGAWNMQLVDKTGKPIPSAMYNNQDFGFLRSDAILPYMPIPCEEDVSFKVHGNLVLES